MTSKNEHDTEYRPSAQGPRCPAGVPGPEIPPVIITLIQLHDGSWYCEETEKVYQLTEVVEDD